MIVFDMYTCMFYKSNFVTGFLFHALHLEFDVSQGGGGIFFNFISFDAFFCTEPYFLHASDCFSAHFRQK